MVLLPLLHLPKRMPPNDHNPTVSIEVLCLAISIIFFMASKFQSDLIVMYDVGCDRLPLEIFLWMLTLIFSNQI